VERPLEAEYKGRVGLTNMGSSLGTAWMVEIELHGGRRGQYGAGVRRLAHADAQCRRDRPQSRRARHAVPAGQIDISFNFLYVVLPLQARGVDIRAGGSRTRACVVRNSLHIVRTARHPTSPPLHQRGRSAPRCRPHGRSPYFFAPTNSGV